MTSKTIKVDYLARVEGEGGLYIKVKDEKVTEVKLKIFEPPRFFEAFLRGRNFTEVPDITARICGICPVAYQMSAVHAMENALGVRVDGQLRELRRLLYCGEWIESHTLHVYMLHAPDFLGYQSSIHMAKDFPDIVKQGLELKKAGNEIVRVVGGREIHPINVRVGGFYKIPSKKDLLVLAEKLKRARDLALETVKWVAKFNFPDFTQDYLFVSLAHENEYPFNEGRIVSSNGLNIDIKEYEDYFVEEHVKHSNALHSQMKTGENYFVGPLARYSLNFDKLSPLTKETALDIGLSKTCKNPFQSIIIRSLEILYALDEALRIINSYETPEQPAIKLEIKSSKGYGATEAPRGMIYHHYKIDDDGLVLEAKIVPPTSQNQKTIERDLWNFVPDRLDLPLDELTWQCEQAIRNYDPCISCATHYLKLTLDKE
ncbi:MAG: Ni/Fe hydrogenase subunit alpha [Acidobacteria bacterium]|nr:Ni/Fe hydrogenase subunit alpha [Acidobacteriota bacterium]